MIKILELNLGNLYARRMRPLEISPVSSGPLQPLEIASGYTPETGWYVNSATGQEVYYDAAARQYYSLQNGVFVPLIGLATWPNTVLNVAPGDTVRFKLAFGYIGPALTGVILNCQVGTINAITRGFVSQTGKTSTIGLIANTSTTPVAYNPTVDVPLLSPGSDWVNIHADISGGSPQTISNPQTIEYANALNIVGTTPVISGFDITSVAKAT